MRNYVENRENAEGVDVYVANNFIDKADTMIARYEALKKRS
jgi:hypothetical protein